MKKYFTITFLFVSVLINAQSYTMPSQPYRNMVYVNPAFTGYYEATVASLMNRTSWVGMPGSPQFQNLEIHAPLKNQSIALGLQARHEQIGPNSTNEVFLNYCHRISLANSKLTFGLKAGAESTTSDNANVPPDDPAYMFTNNYLIPNFGIGFGFYSRNYYAGVSVPYLLGSSLSSDGNTEISAPDINEFNYIVSVGGKVYAGTGITIEPHGLLVYSLTNDPAYEGILNVNFSDKLIVGGGYRSEKAIIGNLGYYLNNQLSFMYSYDYNIGDELGSVSNGSHEIGLLFYFGYKINTINPRDF